MTDGARCPICTSPFTRSNICALKCGHTFHIDCVNEWLKIKKSCPNCRKNCAARDIIPKLYFDYEEDSILGDPSPSNSEKVDELRIEVNKLKSEKDAAKLEMQKAKNEKIVLEVQAEKFKGQISARDDLNLRLREKIHILEDRNQALQHEQKRMAELEDRVKASEFYQMLVKAKGEEQAAEAYKKYVKDGNVEMEQFIKLLKKQCVVYKDRAKAEAEKSKEKDKAMEVMKKKERELQNLIKSLNDELVETRASCNKNTPYNQKLKPFLDRSPVKRISMGFDESAPMIDLNVLESALRKPLAKKIKRHDSIQTIMSKGDRVRDLDEFCALYDQNALPVEDVKPDSSLIFLDKGDGITILRETVDACKRQDVEQYIPPVKRAHIRMEAENFEREEKKITKKRLLAPPLKKKTPPSKNNRISTFFSRNNSSNPPDVIDLD